MTLPDLPAARKPPSRWWLYGPYLAVALAAVAWSGAWVWIRGQVAARLQAVAASGAVGGPSVGWDHVRIGGYPFRIEVVLDGVRASEPSGWGVSAAQVRAETYAYDLKHWIAYAPQGVVLNRPRGAGPVAVAGQAVRASLVLEGPGRNRVSIEGLKLAFAPRAGARPFPLVSAEHLDAHTRPAGPDQVEFLVQLQGAKLAPGGVIGRIAGAAAVSSAWHGTLSRASALSGRDWPQMARAWSAAGGAIALQGADLDAGPLHLQATGGQLAIGPDGRLSGGLSLGLARMPQSLAAFAQAGALDPGLARGAGEIAQARAVASPASRADLSFQAGVATFGPLAIGPSPRIY
jgi:hypothetical protein